MASAVAKFYEGFYTVHIKIRQVHDKFYQKNKVYKKWTDKGYSHAVHKAVLVAFVSSFIIFSSLQSLFPHLFDLGKSNVVLAGSNSKTWTTRGDFNNSTSKSGVAISGTNDGDDANVSLGFGTTPGSDLAYTPQTLSAGASTVSVGDYVYATMGGGNSFRRYSISGNAWSSLTNVPVNIGNGGDLVYDGNNYIYATIGGGTSSFYRYSISGNSWLAMTAVTLSLNTGSAMVHPIGSNFIYVVRAGGTSTFYRYSISGNSWSTMTNAPNNISIGSTGTAYPGEGDYIYVPRGANTTTFYRYSISGNSWDTVANVPTVYGLTSSVAFGGYIYAASGLSKDFYRYSIATNTWNSISSAPENITGGTSLTYPGTGDYIYGTAPEKFFWRYSISENAWRASYFDSFPNPVVADGHKFTTVNDTLYGFQGGGNNGFYRFIPAQNTWAKMANAPLNVSDPAEIVYPGSGDYLYAFFALNSSGFYRYSISNNTWEQRANTPDLLSDGASLTYPGSGDYIYALTGGSTAFYRYSISNNLWSVVASLPYSVYSGATMTSTSSYVFAHTGTDGYFYRYSIAGNAWTVVTNYPSYVDYNSSLSYPGSGDFLYAHGGDSQTDLYRYSISANNWLYIAPIYLGSSGKSNIFCFGDPDMLYLITNGKFVAYKVSENSWYPTYVNSYTPSGTVNFKLGSASKARWGALEWMGTITEAATLQFRTKGADTEDGLIGATWSSYSSASSFQITSDSSTWLEIEAKLATTNPNESPSLGELRVYYDTLSTPSNSGLILQKSNGDAVKKSNGTEIGYGESGGYTNETSLKVVATGLACGGTGTGENACTTPSTNLRPEVQASTSANFTSPITAIAPDNTNAATLTGLAAGSSYYIRVRAVDGQSRVSAWRNYGVNDAEPDTTDITIDRSVPTGTVEIDGGASYTKNIEKKVNLTLTVNEAGGSSPLKTDVDYRLSNNGEAWSNWADYPANDAVSDWDLTLFGGNGDEGVKTVYLQYRDNAGNIGPETNEEAVLGASLDTFISQEWVKANDNYGNSDRIIVSSWNADSEFFNIRAILTFDLAPILSQSNGITQTTLSLLNVDGNTGRTIVANSLTRENITELGLSWMKYDGVNSWSSLGGDYTTANAVGRVVTSGWNNWDVTNLSNNAFQENKTSLSLILKDSIENDEVGVTKYFYSKEDSNPANHPKLAVVYKVTGQATDSITLDTAPPATPNTPQVYSGVGENTEYLPANWYNDSTIDFRWNSVSDAAEYKYCLTAPGGSCTPTTTNGTGTNKAFDLNGLADGTRTFKVMAVDAAGNDSGVASVVYNVDRNIPVPVTDFSASQTEDTTIILNWNAASTGSPLEHYKIERVEYNTAINSYIKNGWNTNSNWETGAGYAVFTTTNITFTETLGVAPAPGQPAIQDSVRYIYKIRVKDVANSEYSPYQENVVTGNNADTAPPTHPSSVVAVACDGTEGKCLDVVSKGFEIKLTWNPSSDSGSSVDHYNVFRSTTGSSSNFVKIGEAPSAIFYDNDSVHIEEANRLNDYTAYYYRITAVDAFDNESALMPSNPTLNSASAMTPDVTPPSAPTSVTASAQGLDSYPIGEGEDETHQKMVITWGPATDTKARSSEPGSGVLGYRLFRLIGGEYIDITNDAYVSCNMGARSCSESRLNDSTTYYYKVKAYDNATPANYSALSGSGSDKTRTNSVPSTPTIVTVTATKGDPSAPNSTVGSTATITFGGSYSKYYQVIRYEVYRSTENYSTEAEWLDGATRLKMVSTGGRNYKADSTGTDINITPAQDERGLQYTIADSGLNDGTTYYYKVRAFDNTPPPDGPFYSGLSGVSSGTLNAGWDITPDTTAPSFAAGALDVKVRDTHPNNVELRNLVTWKMLSESLIPTRAGESDFARYEIWREIYNPNNEELLNESKIVEKTSVGDNYHMDTINLSNMINGVYFVKDCKIKYYIKVADNAGGDFRYSNGTLINSGYSNVSQKEYAPDSIIPTKATPALVGSVRLANISVASAVVSWDTNQDSDGVVEFRKKFVKDINGNNVLNTDGAYTVIGENTSPIQRINTQTHTVRLFGLEANTEYQYRVVSKNYLGNRLEVANVPILLTRAFSITPGEVVTTTSTAEINWTTNLDVSSAFVEFQLQQQAGDDPHSGGVTVSTESLKSNARAHRVLIPGLRSNRTYFYQIKAISTDNFLTEYPAANRTTFKTKTFDTDQFTLTPSSSNVAERNITATTAQIIWETSMPTTSWVDYSTRPGVNSQNKDVKKSVGNNDLTTRHVVMIDGLIPGTIYYYVVRVEDANERVYTSAEYSFKAVLKPKIMDMTIKEITPYSITLSWMTNVETETLINWGRTAIYGEKRGVPGLTKYHEIKIDNLEDNTEYHYQVLATDEAGNEVADADKVVRTPLDTEGPKISNVKTEVLPLGNDDEKASIIISWTTNKPASRMVQYNEGAIGTNYSKSSVLDSTLNTSHTVIVKDLEPATTYRFRLVATDKRGNTTNSNDYTFVTPSKEKSILQLIIKSLEETFSWVKNIGAFFRGQAGRAE